MRAVESAMKDDENAQKYEKEIKEFVKGGFVVG